MDMNKIEQLIKLIDESSLHEIQIKDDNTDIHIVKNAPAAAPMANTAPQPQQPLPVGQPAATPEQVPQQHNTTNSDASSNEQSIKSPMVGTFYRAPNPGSEPFVKEGQTVKKGDVLCIIEAMKIMNQIEAEVDGTITKVVAEDGTPVEYDQPLFMIE